MQSDTKLHTWGGAAKNLIFIAKPAEGELHSDVQQMAYTTKWR